jgi:hypothetical protein
VHRAEVGEVGIALLRDEDGVAQTLELRELRGAGARVVERGDERWLRTFGSESRCVQTEDLVALLAIVDVRGGGWQGGGVDNGNGVRLDGEVTPG